MNQNLFIKKSWKDFQNFDQWPVFFLFFFSINFLNLKTIYFFFFLIDHWHVIPHHYTSEIQVIHQKISITVIGLIAQNIFTKIKLYSGIKTTWQQSYTWFIFWALKQTEKTGKNTSNNLGYTENISVQVSNSTLSIW